MASNINGSNMGGDMKKLVRDYDIVDHGVENEQYFQGCGIAFTKFDECFTGIGDNFAEAISDALEQVAMSTDYDTEDLETRILEDNPLLGGTLDGHKSDVPEDADECHYYTSIRIR
jgi:hypothetical protein